MTNLSRSRYGIAAFFMPVIFIVLFSGCDDNNQTIVTPNEDNIVEYLNDQAGFTVLDQLIEESGLINILNGTEEYTIFAPTDAAFAKLPEGYLDDLTAAQKAEIIAYHILESSVQVGNNSYNELRVTLQGDELFLTVTSSLAKVNNSAVITSKNKTVSNGVIHSVDELLLPDSYGTINENLKKRFDYSDYYSMLEELNITELLDAEGPLSFVIPQVGMLDDIVSYWNTVGFTNEQKTELWKYHIIEQDISELSPGTQTALQTMMGDSLYISVPIQGKYIFNCCNDLQNIPTSVIPSSNGVIYKWDGFMYPDKYTDVLTLMSKRYYLTTVRSGFAVAKMTGRMYNSMNNADEKFTVFIPRNDSPGLENLPTDEEGMASILKYHVLLEKLTADQLLHNQSYTTWSGEEITITRNGDVITINGTATIRLADLEGTNGVVHVI
ncbi:MAG TPA: fasciclin domain-containing protein, partial [Gracilimonas sp.]|uniref:fasciclin domain-containing protein n=1 Tax=Gracilimonas sp. TaxID=1974203 RepID=UPI002DAFC8F9|nr:fasciclin domain-containing protein [Gracilimonas sp.]